MLAFINCMVIREKGKYKVSSKSRPGIFHIVEKKKGNWECSCEAYKFGGGLQCKHIIEVFMAIRSKRFARSAERP